MCLKNLDMRSDYNELGKYIREVNERNSNLAITNLLGEPENLRHERPEK